MIIYIYNEITCSKDEHFFLYFLTEKLVIIFKRKQSVTKQDYFQK